MPPKKAAILDNVFIVTYQHADTASVDFDLCEIMGVYSSLDAANAAAEKQLEGMAEDLDNPIEKKGKNGHGGFKCRYGDASNKEASFILEVSKYDVIHDAPAAKSATKAKPAKAPAKPKAKAPTPEDDEQNDEEMEDAEEEAPMPKKAAPKKAAKENDPKKNIPEGKPNALAGLRLLFTGTFDIDRKTCIATAEKYGATIVKKLDDTDYVVVAARAGPKKIEEIEEKNLDTLSEQEFFDMLKTGVPEEKREQIADRDSPEPPKKKAKK